MSHCREAGAHARAGPRGHEPVRDDDARHAARPERPGDARDEGVVEIHPPRQAEPAGQAWALAAPMSWVLMSGGLAMTRSYGPASPGPPGRAACRRRRPEGSFRPSAAGARRGTGRPDGSGPRRRRAGPCRSPRPRMPPRHGRPALRGGPAAGRRPPPRGLAHTGRGRPRTPASPPASARPRIAPAARGCNDPGRLAAANDKYPSGWTSSVTGHAFRHCAGTPRLHLAGAQVRRRR